MKYIEGTPEEIREFNSQKQGDQSRFESSPDSMKGNSSSVIGIKNNLGEKSAVSPSDASSTNSEPSILETSYDELFDFIKEKKLSQEFVDWKFKLKQENKSKIDNLSIPKNHDQRMYKFGYDTARQELEGLKQENKSKGCGKMYCIQIDEFNEPCGLIDDSHSAYCVKHGRSTHIICGEKGLCKDCKKQENKSNEECIICNKAILEKGFCDKHSTNKMLHLPIYKSNDTSQDKGVKQ